MFHSLKTWAGSQVSLLPELHETLALHARANLIKARRPVVGDLGPIVAPVSESMRPFRGGYLLMAASFRQDNIEKG